MSIIRRTDLNELKKVGRPGVKSAGEAPPAGIAPILRSSWNFAQNMAKRFSQELLKDRSSDFMKSLKNKF